MNLTSNIVLSEKSDLLNERSALALPIVKVGADAECTKVDTASIAEYVIAGSVNL